MDIREARPGEYDATGALMVEAYGEYAAILGEEIWREYAEEITDVRSRLDEATLLVAEDDDGELLGAVTYYAAGTGGGYDASWPREWAGFRLLAVPPRARGRRIGHALTQACIARAASEGAEVLALGTTDMMKTARAMYERMGFEPSPEHDYYPVPEVRVYCYLIDPGRRGMGSARSGSIAP